MTSSKEPRAFADAAAALGALYQHNTGDAPAMSQVGDLAQRCAAAARGESDGYELIIDLRARHKAGHVVLLQPDPGSFDGASAAEIANARRTLLFLLSRTP